MSTLKLNRQQVIKLPVGGEAFTPTGLIGQFVAAILYGFMTEADMHMFTGFKCDSSRKMGDWHRYYYADYDEAKKWNEQAQNKYAPSVSWVVQAATQNVLNISEKGREKFGDHVTFDHCKVGTLRSKKYRHELHMMALPCAVSAYARAEGWDVPGFDVSELIDPERAFTDDFQSYMTGSPDAKAQDYKDFQVAHDLAMATFGDQAAEVIRRLVLNMSTDEFGDILEPIIIEAKDVNYIHYEWSVMWERRTALWQSLGSDDPKPYRPSGTAEEEGKPKNAKHDAPANTKLDEALGILAYPWADYAWVKVLSVPDPRVDAVYGDEAKRLSVPCIVKIYNSEEEARVEAAAEMAGREGNGDAPPVSSVVANVPTVSTPEVKVDLPAIPEAWDAYQDKTVALDKWTAEVKKLKAKYPGPLPIFTQQVEAAQETGVLQQEHACTAAEAVQWYPLV